MGWNFYNASGELQINDGGVQASAAVFTGKVDLGSNLLVGNGGSTGIAISANGEVTMAAQPCVFALNGADDANVTGNGTEATVDFDTEIFDQNGDFTNDTFTAPVTGRYLICAVVSASGLTDASTRITLKIVADNRITNLYASGAANSSIYGGQAMAAIIDMDANDDVTIIFRVEGEGSDVVDIEGGATHPESSFSAVLVA
jgi:hypothetical protein